jgi:hypothetical protein
LKVEKLMATSQTSCSHFPSTLCLYLCLYLCLFPSSSALAQVGTGLPSFRQPPQVRIIGTLAPLDDKQPSKIKTLTVYVKGKSWKLRIQEITALTATTQSGWGLLKNLLPPKLHLVGADELLLPLAAETIAGKQLTIEGRLYVGEHQLLVSDVQTQEGN